VCAVLHGEILVYVILSLLNSTEYSDLFVFSFGTHGRYHYLSRLFVYYKNNLKYVIESKYNLNDMI